MPNVSSASIPTTSTGPRVRARRDAPDRGDRRPGTGRRGTARADAFIEQGSTNPPTVNPSLWRQAQLNNIHGLFQVDDGLWQARGYDISNVTFIAGDTGWVIIDPLTVEATARACLALANEHLGERPVTAVIYTHSHTDHFGGVLGVTTQADVDAGRCRIIAPDRLPATRWSARTSSPATA